MAAPILALASLKTTVADHLNRSDLSATGGAIEVAVQLAEQRFQRDPRVREPGSNNSVLPSLFSTDPNWLLTAEPDIYYWGVLVELQPYLRDDDRVEVYEARLQDALDKLSGSVRLDPNRTLAISTYANLQTLVADALNRGDIKNVIPVLIVMAERRLGTDRRVRNLTTATLSITGDDLAVPSGFREVESFYFENASGSYFPLEIVGGDELPTLKARYGPSGVPKYVALHNGYFRFAPAPDTTYSAKITYWQTITALASGVNWLYTAYPEIYLRATLAEAGPWVRDDARALATVEEAKARLEEDITLLDNSVWGQQWAGTMRRQFAPIG